MNLGLWIRTIVNGSGILKWFGVEEPAERGGCTHTHLPQPDNQPAKDQDLSKYGSGSMLFLNSESGSSL